MRYLMNRRADLLKFGKTDEVDTYIVVGSPNVQYLTGFESAGAVIVHSKSSIYICDDLDAVPVPDETPGSWDDIEIVTRASEQTLAQAVGETLAKLGAKNVGYDVDATTAGDVERISAKAGKAVLKPVRGRLAGLRVIKDASEIEAIRSSAIVSDRAFNMFRVLLHESDTEKEMSDALDSYVRRAGGRSSFQTSVLVGERAALPGAKPGDRKIADSSKFVASWGVDSGYKFFSTRSLKSPFAVTPTRRTKAERLGHDFEKVSEAVVAAHEAAIKTMYNPEITLKEVYAAAREKIAAAGYAEHFPHCLGHGIGLDLIEPPFITADSTELLRPGMVLVLKTGLTLPGWGAFRLADTLLYTRNDGGTPLSLLPFDPAKFE